MSIKETDITHSPKPSTSKTPTSPDTLGELDLHDIVKIKTVGAENELEFKVVGIIADEHQQRFGILYCEDEDQFVVTDAHGELLHSEDMAQEILDDFFELAEE